jgi:ABC-type nickel/cobalt efflux system permease component RcnA
MRLNSTRRSMRKGSWTLIFSWSVFAVFSALAPFCSGWAAIETAANHAAHHTAPAHADDHHDPAHSGQRCCHTTFDATVDDPRDELAQSAIALEPISTVAWSAVAAVSTPASILHATPGPRPPLPVFLNTRRLRI